MLVTGAFCPQTVQSTLFFYEALAVCSTFVFTPIYKCALVAIYLENTNMVDMFGSLRAKSIYNLILMTAMDLSVNNSITTKVYYMSGHQNVVTDCLLLFLNARPLQ